MKKNTPQNYIYSFSYNHHHKELCKLESRQLFGEEENNNLLFSDINIDPSISPFIKRQFEIIFHSESYDDLLKSIEIENISIDNFKVEYLVLEGDPTHYQDRLNKLRDIGYRIDGEPEYTKPSTIYSVCYNEGLWYFGILIRHNADWLKHKKKPYSFSSSINMEIAKTLVSIASKGKKDIKLLDACCGVGTAVLEGCIAGFDIEGCDINWKACVSTRKNLAHYGYASNIYRSDIKDLDKKYDAAIIDLPYNLYTYSDDTITLNIIASAAKLAKRIIVVSITDIESIINEAGLKVTDFGTVDKQGKSAFVRNVWVCEKVSN